MKFAIFGEIKKENILRTVIIDDEYHCSDTMVNMLEMNCPDLRVVGQASGVVSSNMGIAVDDDFDSMVNPQMQLP